MQLTFDNPYGFQPLYMPYCDQIPYNWYRGYLNGSPRLMNEYPGNRAVPTRRTRREDCRRPLYRTPNDSWTPIPIFRSTTEADTKRNIEAVNAKTEAANEDVSNGSTYIPVHSTQAEKRDKRANANEKSYENIQIKSIADDIGLNLSSSESSKTGYDDLQCSSSEAPDREGNDQDEPQAQMSGTVDDDKDDDNINERLNEIATLTEEAENTSQRIDAFSGDTRSKEFLFCEEMLTKCLLKLDGIPTNGNTDVRLARKRLANFIDAELGRLENKLDATTKDL